MVSIRRVVLLQLGLAFLVAAGPVEPRQAMITPAPVLRRATKGADWLGYYTVTSPGSVEVLEYSVGDDVSFSTSDGYIGACTTTDLNWKSDCKQSLFTDCIFGSELVAESFIFTCSDACITALVYPSSVMASASANIWFACADTADLLVSFFQVDPRTDAFFSTEDFYSSPTPRPSQTPSPTRSSSSSSSSSTSPTASSSVPPRGSPSSSPTVTSSSAEDPPDPQSQGSSHSKSWIAGAVLGPLAFVSLAGIAFFLIRRRRRNAEPAYQVAPQTSAFSPPPHAEGFPAALPPPVMNCDPKNQWMSETTASGSVSNTWSIYSGSQSGGMNHGSMQDLPEFVPARK